MPREIERKFLVQDDGWRRSAAAGRAFVQGYLAETARAVVRVRIDDRGAAWLTVKSAAPGLTRDEYEYPIPPADGERLIALCEAVITKTRFEVVYGGWVWEVDVYSGESEGLVMAEIELPSVDAPHDLPPWVGPEVTGDPRYYASRLAREPFRRWAGAPAGAARA